MDRRGKIRLELEPILEINETPGEVYFTYGPLVLANPIEAIETKTRAYGLTEFCDVQYKPASFIIDMNNTPRKHGKEGG